MMEGMSSAITFCKQELDAAKNTREFFQQDFEMLGVKLDMSTPIALMTMKIVTLEKVLARLEEDGHDTLH